MMLEAHARERVFVITARGEWDLLTAPAMEHMLRAATSGHWPVVVVDLGDVAFMDLAGAAPLRQAARDCADDGLAFFLVHPPRAVERVLQVCGLAEHVVPVEQLPYPLRESDATSARETTVPAQP